jgi:hypothetical protein
VDEGIDFQPYEFFLQSSLVITSHYCIHSFDVFRVVNPAIVSCESNGRRVAVSIRFRMFAHYRGRVPRSKHLARLVAGQRLSSQTAWFTRIRVFARLSTVAVHPVLGLLFHSNKRILLCTSIRNYLIDRDHVIRLESAVSHLAIHLQRRVELVRPGARFEPMMDYMDCPCERFGSIHSVGMSSLSLYRRLRTTYRLIYSQTSIRLDNWICANHPAERSSRDDTTQRVEMTPKRAFLVLSPGLTLRMLRLILKRKTGNRKCLEVPVQSFVAFLRTLRGKTSCLVDRYRYQYRTLIYREHLAESISTNAEA